MDLTVCVQFSGGSDSSLTAYRAAQEFDRVYLLTFRHFGHVGIENSQRSFRILNRRVPGKFTHCFLDIDETFESIYYADYAADLLKYRTLMIQFTCFACQAAFHVHTILHCLKNGITHVRDGANTEYEDISPMQIQIVREKIGKFYADYGIHHSSPIYDEYGTARSDYQLYELGLRKQHNIKDDPDQYTAFQGYCKFMPGSTVFLHYRKRCRDFPAEVRQKTLAHWFEKCDLLKTIIDDNTMRS